MKANYKSTIIMMLASFGSIAQTQQFNSQGSHSFVVPDGVLSVKVEAIGGGGGGGRVRGSSARESGGGGGGAYARGIVNVVAGDTYDVGVGVAGVQNGSVSRHGGNSYFGSHSSSDASTTVRAEGARTLILSDGSDKNGAQGGKAANSVGNKAKYDGGNGGTTNSNDYGGGGGGAAGSNGPGGNGGQGAAGIGTSSYGGNGGAGGVSGGDDDGTDGTNYGGGGGGARKSFSGSTVNRYGSSGAGGIVIVSWCTITDFSPASICAGAGSTITVTGTNLTHIDSVSVNGINVPFTSVDNTQFTITVPSGASSGNIIVHTGNGSSVSQNILAVNDYSVSLSLAGATLTANYTGTSAAVYEWKNCVSGSFIAGASSETFTPDQNGLYSVRITENGCVTTSQCAVVSSVSLNNLNGSDLLIYPNPSKEVVNIKTVDHVADLIVLTDLNGKRIMEIAPSDITTELQLNDVDAGLYVVTISIEGQTYRKQLSVAK